MTASNISNLCVKKCFGIKIILHMTFQRSQRILKQCSEIGSDAWRIGSKFLNCLEVSQTESALKTVQLLVSGLHMKSGPQLA